jgi:hypothetical protein
MNQDAAMMLLRQHVGVNDSAGPAKSFTSKQRAIPRCSNRISERRRF